MRRLAFAWSLIQLSCHLVAGRILLEYCPRTVEDLLVPWKLVPTSVSLRPGVLHTKSYVTHVEKQGRGDSDDGSNGDSNEDLNDDSDDEDAKSDKKDDAHQQDSTKEHVLSPFTEAFDCDHVYARRHRPIHNESTWLLLRGAYQAVMGPGGTTLKNLFGDGFLVDYVVDYLPHKGRSVFAAQDIPQGTGIYAQQYKAIFRKSRVFLWFLTSLPYDLACDVIDWCYLGHEDYHEYNGTLEVYVDLDPSSYINRMDSLSELNIRGDYRAIRDIKSGEELVLKYDDFYVDELWASFELE